MPEDQAQVQPQAQTHPQAQIQPQTQPPTVRARIESKFPRGLVIRLFAYLFAGHLFAFFLYLLFALGADGQ